MRFLRLTLAALGACVLSSGCVAAVATAGAGVGFFAMQDRSIGEGIDDSAATAEIRTRLLAADSSAFSAVHVRVGEGNVLLSGAVPTEQHKQTAEIVARSLRTVHNVYNELSVGERRGLGRGVNDEWIAAQIRTRYTASPSVTAINVGIEVYNGNVYLTGIARSDHELHRAAEIASTAPGVRRVVSFMQVRERLPTYAAAPAPAPVYGAPEPPPNGAPMIASNRN